MLCIAQRWYWRGLGKISKTCVDWKGCYWLTRYCEFWVLDEFRTDNRLHWTAPLIFSAIPCHASQTWCDWDLCSWSVFPIITAVEYEVLRNFWDTSMGNITFINITYMNDCTVTYLHALHTHMGYRCIPRTAQSVNEIGLPTKFNLTNVMRFWGLHTYMCASVKQLS